MRPLYTPAEVQAQERAAAEAGVSMRDLMERAGRALAETAYRMRASSRAGSGAGRVFVLAGGGNNGGDGLVAARALDARGVSVHTWLLGAPDRLPWPASEVASELSELLRSDAPFDAAHQPRPGDVAIDALFGIGLNRAPAGRYAEAIALLERWRRGGVAVVAADVPSGLRADVGTCFEPCVTADRTVCFGVMKLGMALAPGIERCGDIEVVDIGLQAAEASGGVSPGATAVAPADVSAGVPSGATAAGSPGVSSAPLAWLLDDDDARTALPTRAIDGHKGDHGHLLVIAGGPGKSGAAALVARAAMRAGAGLVTVAARPGVLEAAMAHVPEAMGEVLPGDGPLGLADEPSLRALIESRDAVACGPGIPRGEETAALIERLVAGCEIPWVLDADALNAFAQRPEALALAAGRVVLTPHPGEAARLLGISTREVQADRPAAARELARRSGACVVLKGARTVVAEPDGTLRVVPTGNPGMATAGSGDVLTGILGALLAERGRRPTEAAWLAPYVHGLAADHAVTRTGVRGLMASDIAEGLRSVWRGWAQ